MKHKFESEEEALQVVRPYADIVDDVITPHDIPPFNRFFDRDLFWDAMQYLQIEHDYVNGNNIPFLFLDDDDEEF